MHNNYRVFIIFLVGIFSLFTFDDVFAFKKYDPDYEWKTIETSHFLFHYHNGVEAIAKELTVYGEEIQAEISEYFNWVPAEKTQVIISDQQDAPNGFALILPYNRIEIFAAPPSKINSLEDFDNWKETVFKHEYVHTIQIDMARDFPLHMRAILGRWGYLFPGQFMPSWIKEGIATYLETDSQQGIGRGQSSYFRGLMRNEFIHGIKSLNMVNQIPLDWPNGTTPYLYGVYFFKFLNAQYGDSAIREFFNYYASIPIPFFLNHSSKKTTGFNFYYLWQQFEQHLATSFDKEISRIKDEPYYSLQLSKSGYYSGFSRVSNNDKVLYIENNLEQPASIEEYNPKTRRTRTIFQMDSQSLSGFSGFDYHPDQGLVIPITDNVKNSRYPTNLFVYNLQTQKFKKITKDARYIRAVWSPDGNSLAVVHVENGQHKLLLLNAEGELQSLLSEPGYDNLIGPIDWSPTENKIAASVFRPDDGWNLEIFNLDTQQWSKLTNNSFIESDPQFNASGTKLLYTAEYDGVYNIYEFDLTSKNANKITNTLTVAYQPVYANQDNVIYYAQLGAKGFDLYSTNTNNTSLSYIDNRYQGIDKIPEIISEEPLADERAYNAIRHLKPTWWFPVLAFSNNESSVGLVTSSTDPLFWHNYLFQFDYDFKNNNPGWIFSYTYQRFFPNLSLASVRETFFSTIEPTQHENLYKFEIELPFIKNKYRISAKTSYQYTDIEQDIESVFRNYTAKADTEHLVASLSVDTRNMRKRAYLPYDGFFALLMLENEDLDREIKRNSRLVLRAKYHSPLFKQNIIDAEATVVMSGGLTEELSVGGQFREPDSMYSFVRRNYNLKGYKSGTFHGSSMQRLQLSWNLLAAQPQTSFMAPPFGVSRMYFKTYAMAARIANYREISSTSWMKSLGTEIQINSDFGYRFWQFAIIAGIAQGLDEDGQLLPYFEISFAF